MRIFDFGADYVNERKLRKEEKDAVNNTGAPSDMVNADRKEHECGDNDCQPSQEKGEEEEVKEQETSSKPKKAKGKG